jgi:hypothetical protein
MSTNVVLSSSISDTPYTLSDYANDLYTLFFQVESLSPADKILQRSLLKAIHEASNAKPDVDVSLISEESGIWQLLQKRVHDLSVQKLQTKSKDQPHWIIIYDLTEKSK